MFIWEQRPKDLVPSLQTLCIIDIIKLETKDNNAGLNAEDKFQVFTQEVSLSPREETTGFSSVAHSKQQIELKPDSVLTQGLVLLEDYTCLLIY